MQCQTGWTRSGLSCYLLVRAFKELNDAETDCVSKGGHLASITSDNENSVVLSLRGTSTADANDTWIGLHDRVVENTFIWTDDTKSTYTNWDPAGNEPNDSGDCVRIRSDGKWRDHNCSFLYPYVCESNATLSTTQTPTTLSATTSAGATALLSTATASGTQWQTRDSTSRSRHTSVPITTTDSTEYAKSSKTSSSATTSRSNVKPSKRMIHLTRYTQDVTLILITTTL